MKRDAPSNSKMKRLCRMLDIPLYQAVGMLELIWHLTAREAPEGNIGKLSNEDIAIALDYRGDENRLIKALVHTGWLTESSRHRLLIHDWREHADEAVKKKLSRSGRSFIENDFVSTNGQYVETNGTNGDLRVRAGPEPEPVASRTPEPEPEPEEKPTSAGADCVAFPPLETDEAVLELKEKNLPPAKRAVRKLQRAIIRRLFAYYLQRVGRTPLEYELTLARLDKGLARLHDCERKCNGDIVKAEEMMVSAIDLLLASGFHTGKNDRGEAYLDWTNNLFKSKEKLEWWLAKRSKPTTRVYMKSTEEALR